MVLAHYIVGLLLGLVSIGPLLAGSWRLRARGLPGWSGAPARVAEAILVCSLLVVVLEVVGVIGELNRPVTVAVCAVAGLGAWIGAGLIGPGAITERGSGPATRHVRVAWTVAIGASAAVTAVWVGWTVFAYGHGMYTIDTLWYHLPTAARFMQTGSILHIHYVDPNPVTPFYPANSELFHAFGLLLFRSDLVSPALNLGWAALALAAGWSIGRPFGRAAHCLVAALLILATPALVDTQPGGAYNDVVCLAFLLSGVAMLVNGGIRPRTSALAAMAAGLALGTKFTMIAPALALGVGVVAISARGTRVRQAAIWAGGLVVLGGFWYLRNAVQVGNPLPPVAVHIGPLSLPSPHVATQTFTVGQYLTNLNIVRGFYAPGLQTALGPAWWAILALAAAGSLAAAISGGDRVRRMLGCVAVVSAGAYLISPQFLGQQGAPYYFVVNVRYAAAPIVLGLVLLPIHPSLARAWRGALWLGAAGVVLLATELDPGVWPTGLRLKVWPTNLRLKAFAAPISGTPAVVGALVGAAILALGVAWVWSGWRLTARRGRVRRSRIATTLVRAGALGAVAVAGWGVANAYAHRRYSSIKAPLGPGHTIAQWDDGIRGTRIGLAGSVMQYPLYGADSSNYVQFIGASKPHGGFGLISSCRQWRQVVDRGHYNWLVLFPFAFPYSPLRIAPEVAWTRTSPAATAVILEHASFGFPGDTAFVFRITGPLDPSGCPANRARR